MRHYAIKSCFKKHNSGIYARCISSVLVILLVNDSMNSSDSHHSSILRSLPHTCLLLHSFSSKLTKIECDQSEASFHIFNSAIHFHRLKAHWKLVFTSLEGMYAAEILASLRWMNILWLLSQRLFFNSKTIGN